MDKGFWGEIYKFPVGGVCKRDAIRARLFQFVNPQKLERMGAGGSLTRDNGGAFGGKKTKCLLKLIKRGNFFFLLTKKGGFPNCG